MKNNDIKFKNTPMAELLYNLHQNTFRTINGKIQKVLGENGNSGKLLVYIEALKLSNRSIFKPLEGGIENIRQLKYRDMYNLHKTLNTSTAIQAFLPHTLQYLKIFQYLKSTKYFILLIGGIEKCNIAVYNTEYNKIKFIGYNEARNNLYSDILENPHYQWEDADIADGDILLAEMKKFLKLSKLIDIKIKELTTKFQFIDKKYIEQYINNKLDIDIDYILHNLQNDMMQLIKKQIE